MKKHFRTTFRLLCLVAVTMSCSVAISAQTVTGTLQGTVVDTKAAVVSGADVVIRNVETGQERTLTTNSEGYYSASFLPLGRYTVTASGQGFAAVKQENVDITLNKTRVIDFTLSPGGVAEAVTINADVATINTTNSEVKQSLNTQEILAKPTLNQGSFLTLAETVSLDVANVNFGRITGTATQYQPRNIQVSLRYQY